MAWRPVNSSAEAQPGRICPFSDNGGCVIDRPRFERQDVTPRLRRVRAKDMGVRGERGGGSFPRENCEMERERAKRFRSGYPLPIRLAAPTIGLGVG